MSVSRFLNVRICCFSLLYIIISSISLGFAKNKTFVDVTLDSEELIKKTKLKLKKNCQVN